MNNDNKHNTFREIKDDRLRVFNQAIMALNIREAMGDVEVAKYFNLFSQTEQFLIFGMFIQISQKGEENVRKEVTDKLVLEDVSETA